MHIRDADHALDARDQGRKHPSRMSMPNAMEPADRPVTVLVTRRVRPGHEARFEQVMQRMVTAAQAFPGHLGSRLIRPVESGEALYQVVFAFARQAQLDVWLASPERHALLDGMNALTQAGTGDAGGATRVLSGLESWFALPAQATRMPPPRHKMALVTWCGIFPLVLLWSHLVAPVLVPIHPVLSVMAVTAGVVVSMTWAVMPLLTRWFAPWLYPQLGAPDTASNPSHS
jgi:antibiotic biosynthesis monooxygenase (ABM) superfamily enzyme